MKTLALISLVILLLFVVESLRKFGLLGSYSAYSLQWMQPFDDFHIWSVVTFVCAVLMVPPMLELGEGSDWQFLGFFAPAYLIVVALTPEYELKDTQRKVHTFGALACAAMAFSWMLLVCHTWYFVAAAAAAVVVAATAFRRWDAFIFWGELVMFSSTYLTLLTM